MAEVIQRSFTGGEISPALRVRIDQVKYQTGLALCRNFYPKAQGGVYSRPGFRFIDAIGDSSKRARLIPFSFNTEQTYALLFEHLKLRFIRNGAYVISSGVPYEIATPYTEAQLSRLQYTQSADVMTIVHPSHAVRNLSRLAENNWTLTAVNFTPDIVPPSWVTTTSIAVSSVSNANPAVVTTSSVHNLSTGNYVDFSGVTGITSLNTGYYLIEVTSTTTFRLVNTNLSGSGSPASGGTVGRAILSAVGEGAGDYDKTYTYVVTSVDAKGSESIAGLPASITTKSLSTTAAVHLEWQAVAGADYYRIYKDPSNGTGIYGFIGESQFLIFEDFNFAPITSDSPPEARDPLSGTGNYPATVTYYQQRQIFANTNNEKQSVYTTQVADFNNMRTSSPARDTDAVTFAIAGRQVNEIRHLVALDALLILTSGSEWKVTEGQDEVLSPSTVGVRVQSYNGANWVTPAVVDDTVIYVQEKGSKLRDLTLSPGEFKYGGTDLSIFAEHLLKDYEIQEMAYSDEPDGILWIVRNDGVLLGFTYQREHQVWAWHQHITDGQFESVISISESQRDAVYVIVKRTIEGVTKRYVERLEPRITSSAADAFFVDSGLSYTGVLADEFSGLDHLEGKAVVALADGAVYEDLEVVGGAVTLPTEATEVHIGLPYTCAIETLNIDSLKSTIAADTMSVSKVTLLLEASRGGFVQRISDTGIYSEAYEIKPRYQSDNYDTLSLKSITESTVVSDGWDFSGKLRIEQRAPLPMAILGLIPDVDVGG